MPPSAKPKVGSQAVSNQVEVGETDSEMSDGEEGTVPEAKVVEGHKGSQSKTGSRGEEG